MHVKRPGSPESAAQQLVPNAETCPLVVWLAKAKFVALELVLRFVLFEVRNA